MIHECSDHLDFKCDKCLASTIKKMNKLDKLIILGEMMIVSYLPACGQKTYDQKLESLYQHTVPLIQARALDSLQNERPVIVLDTRSSKEYAVSHLPGARLVNYDDFTLDAVKDVPKDAEVIVYCSVGYRSERVGEQMQEAGYQHVQNLYGGIFAWKNEGQTVVDQRAQPTDSVHTYNRSWSKWLEKGIKVY